MRTGIHDHLDPVLFQQPEEPLRRMVGVAQGKYRVRLWLLVSYYDPLPRNSANGTENNPEAAFSPDPLSPVSSIVSSARMGSGRQTCRVRRVSTTATHGEQAQTEFQKLLDGME
jgi:hypothetical protein